MLVEQIESVMKRHKWTEGGVIVSMCLQAVQLCVIHFSYNNADRVTDVPYMRYEPSRYVTSACLTTYIINEVVNLNLNFATYEVPGLENV